jgi:hypothetical protein
MKKCIILIPKEETTEEDMELAIEQFKNDAEQMGKDYPFITQTSYKVEWE